MNMNRRLTGPLKIETAEERTRKMSGYLCA